MFENGGGAPACSIPDKTGPSSLTLLVDPARLFHSEGLWQTLRSRLMRASGAPSAHDINGEQQAMQPRRSPDSLLPELQERHRPRKVVWSGVLHHLKASNSSLEPSLRCKFGFLHP